MPEAQSALQLYWQSLKYNYKIITGKQQKMDLNKTIHKINNTKKQ